MGSMPSRNLHSGWGHLGSSEVWGCTGLGGMFLFRDQHGSSLADFVLEREEVEML